MTKLLWPLMLLLLTGCVKPDGLDKRQQDYACKDAGGVFNYIRYFGTLSNKVRCNDGSYQNWVNTIIKVEN